LLQDFLESSVRLTVISATTIRDVLEHNYNSLVLEQGHDLASVERHNRDEVITGAVLGIYGLLRDLSNSFISNGH